LQRFAYPLVIALAVILIFWKITLTGQFTWMNGVDTSQQVLPWLQLQAREWHRGHFPLIDPFHWAGQPVIGQTQPGSTYPLNWLLFALPLKHGRLQVPILNGYFVFIHILGAWAMFALLRTAGLALAAAALAAVAFGAGGYMAEIEWPQFLNGAVWLPLVLLFWIRFLRAPGRFVDAALSGAAGGLALLSGHHSAPVMILTSVAALTMHGCLEKRRTVRRLLHLAAGLALFGLFFFLLGAVQSLPATEYWRVAYRFVNTKAPVTFDQVIPYLVHRHYSLDPASLPGLVINGFHRDAALNPFLGAGLVTLAFLGFQAFRTVRAARRFLFLAVFSLLLAMGENSILHGLFYAAFPMFDKLRNPSMLILPVHLSLIALAAMGLQAVGAGVNFRHAGKWLLRIGCAAFALLTLLYAVDPAKASRQQAASLAALSAIGLGACLLAPSKPGTRAFLIGMLILAETGANSTKGYPDREMGFANLDKLASYDDIAAFLTAERRAAPFRITVDDSVELQCFGAWYGLEQANGCVNMSINMFREQWRPEVPLLLSARYHVGPKPRLPDQVRRFTGKSGQSVWESPQYAPWTWTAHRFERITEGQLADRYLRGWPAVAEPLFALSGEANPAVCEAADAVRLTDLRPEYGRVEATMACPGLLVYSAANLPGWHATIDGNPAPILEAYGKLMAVSAPAGHHIVEFHYAPASVRLGALLTIAGLLSVAIWWRVSGRRESESPSLPRPAET
jgi:hypothetical protein